MNLDHVRVTDGKSGNAWTTLREIAKADGLTIIDEEAIDTRTGRPLPPSRLTEPAKPAQAPAGETIETPATEPAKAPKPRNSAGPVTEPATK